MPIYKFIVHDMIFLSTFFQIGDLKGFFGLFMVQMQQLRKKLKVLDFTYGSGTGITLPYAVLVQIINVSLEGYWPCGSSNKCVNLLLVFQLIRHLYIIMVNSWLCQKLISLVSIQPSHILCVDELFLLEDVLAVNLRCK